MPEGTMVSGAAAQPNTAPPPGSHLKHVAITAAIGAVSTVLQDVYAVPEEESAMLLQSFRALLNRLFGHKSA